VKELFRSAEEVGESTKVDEGARICLGLAHAKMLNPRAEIPNFKTCRRNLCADFSRCQLSPKQAKLKFSLAI